MVYMVLFFLLDLITMTSSLLLSQSGFCSMKVVRTTSTMNIDLVKRKRHCPILEIPRHQKVVGFC